MLFAKKKRGQAKIDCSFCSFIGMRQRKAKNESYLSNLCIGYLTDIWFVTNYVLF
jgi:hypothetical protein